MTTQKNKVYTIGYGNEKIDKFIDKLKEVGIDLLIDVRSSPYSKWRPEFNTGNLREILKLNGISYEWRGRRLGGFGVQHHYAGIKEIKLIIEKYKKVVLMCAEENPDKCHRKQNLQPILEQEDFEVIHIRFKEEEKSFNLSLF
ncbi:MAG: Uncharacterized protein XE08_0355 [Parcubacteria bacterium 32_520]|nr:MAG: Uncharacterized protein XE08_0355 [Parcubacteria bacterium 32_520]